MLVSISLPSKEKPSKANRIIASGGRAILIRFQLKASFIVAEPSPEPKPQFNFNSESPIA